MTSPETLNTKVAVNKISFPLVTHTVLSDLRFDSYGLLKSGNCRTFSGQAGHTTEFLGLGTYEV
jgi:hypothetical protein